MATEEPELSITLVAIKGGGRPVAIKCVLSNDKGGHKGGRTVHQSARS